MTTLHLTLSRKWFDMILSGEKKEEYREIKPHWEKRLKHPEYSGINEYEFKTFDRIVFKNGYDKNAPVMTVECLGIKQDTGLEQWGAEPGRFYFVIKLGTVFSIAR